MNGSAAKEADVVLDPYATGRLVMLLSVVSGMYYPNDTPEIAVGTTLSATRRALEKEAGQAFERAGRDAFARDQLDFAVSEIRGVLALVEPLAIEELRTLRRPGNTIPNPDSEQGQAALYAWVGAMSGTVVGGLVGLILGVSAAAAGMVGAGMLLATLGGWAGGIAGARIGVGYAPIRREDMRDAKNYATFGELLFPWFGVGAAVGAAMGTAHPEENPQISPAVRAVLATPWPARLREIWGESGWMAGEVAQEVVRTASQAGWSESDVVRDASGAMNEAVSVWDSEPSGSSEALEHRENPAKRKPKEKVTVDLLTMDDGKFVKRTVVADFATKNLAVHPSSTDIYKIAQGDYKLPKEWKITHLKTGAALGGTGSKGWAKKLAVEFERLLGDYDGFNSNVVDEVRDAFSQAKLKYLSHMMRQGFEPSKTRGEFVRYEKWWETSGELEHPRAVRREAEMEQFRGKKR